MVSDQDVAQLRRAHALALCGPVTDPNPRVGCVLVSPSGDVVGEGFHAGAGTPHAEVTALRAAGESARGATAFVTLEPCGHHGRTGPCADALIEAGIARVVHLDSDPSAVAGGGAARLRDAGVDVEGPVETDLPALNRYWEHAARTGRPFVTWKYGATLDGRVAAADGTSRWVTSPESRADVHRRRSTAGAIVVGTGTVLADDPALTVRDSDDRPADRQPLRVVVGEREIPTQARVLADDNVLHLRTHDVVAVLTELHEREVRHVWLEGGPTLAAAFLRAGAVDEVLAYVAPQLLGAGPSLVAGLGITTLEQRVTLQLNDVERLGPDVLLRLTPDSVKEAH